MSAKIPKVEAPNETTSLTSRRVEGAMAATEATEAEETTQIPPEIDAELLFDLQMVLDGFSQCKREDGQLYLDGYLRAYSEINKFFQILGNVFNLEWLRMCRRRSRYSSVIAKVEQVTITIPFSP
ncbi:uncharacterized protein LOC122249431 [Penaeus japonicus]|uniref:uncharacterized protein LOC122249431 n=1 Tax=Penaeus japonicus TaxID=27405 RepID=UPI001C7106B1|nr:uncharacterized protein LOC122249431 [Penaeus japonicus]